MNYKPKENQVGGTHYCKYDAWYFADKYNLDRYETPAIKYLLRYHKKNGAEDLRKSIDYIRKKDTKPFTLWEKIQSNYYIMTMQFSMDRDLGEAKFFHTIDLRVWRVMALIIESKRSCTRITNTGAIETIEQIIKELENKT